MFIGSFLETMMRNGAAKAGISVLIVYICIYIMNIYIYEFQFLLHWIINNNIYYYTGHLSTIPKSETKELRRTEEHLFTLFIFCTLNIFIPCILLFDLNYIGLFWYITYTPLPIPWRLLTAGWTVQLQIIFLFALMK